MTFSVTTLETRKTEAGTILKLQEKKVVGEHTTYQVMTIRSLGDSGLVLSGASFSEACDCMDWWMNGCPA